MGNIGSGHAANALAEMLNRRVDLSLPRFQILTTQQLSQVRWQGHSPAQHFAVVLVRTQGTKNFDILVVFDVRTTRELIGLIRTDSELNEEFDLTKLNSFDQSAIREVGNILALHYLTAVSEFLGGSFTTAFPSSPVLMVEASETILATIAAEFMHDFSHVMTVECDIQTSNKHLSPLVILIPEEAALESSLELLFGESTE